MNHTVTAKRWEHGWELHIGDVGVTQSRTLGSEAERMVRDYLRLDHHADAETADIDIVPELGDLGEAARRARCHTREAAEAQRDAAREARDVARQLRAEGLSVTDTAAVLGVSRGRVSQLVKAN